MKKLRMLGRRGAALALATAVLSGCSIDDLIATDQPTGFVPADPDAFNNEQGTYEMYKGVLNKFREATTGKLTGGGYVVMTGLLGDELNAGRINTATAGGFNTQSIVDGRSMATGDGSDGGYEGVWRQLHGVRAQAMNTIPALRKYGPNQPKDYTGHAYALWGMAETMLANFFCSGIPLTTVQFEGTFTYASGSTTQEVYEHALKMFDSSLVYAQDSVDVRNLAMVGKGWALLNLGRFDEAAAAVAAVPTPFVYTNLHSDQMSGSTGTPTFTFAASSHAVGDMGTVSDLEGGNGLPYRSSGDPRTLSSKLRNAAPSSGTADVYKPDRWMFDGGNTSVIMASGVEARLIEAEAALRSGSAAWLTILNALRTDGTFTTAPNPTDPTVEDTTWGVGDGAVLFTAVGGSLPGLAPLEDPGTPAARVDLLFRERAYWLFLTGRRQPDLRRLIRQYGRTHETVFPRGPYSAGPVGSYGVDVNAPAPAVELLYNSEYDGCFDRQA